MNKQALAFLTMFSLVLMLSVYYVTLPSDSTSVVTKDSSKNQENASKQSEENANTSNEAKNDSKQEVKTDAAASLQEEINQNLDASINKNSEIIANKDSKEEEKQSALEAMDTLKSQKELQTAIKEALLKDKINVAVEIKDTTCTISVFDQKDDKALATSIMKTANSLTNNKYLIEVTFK